MVWYSHLFQNFPQFIVIHTVKGFGIVNKAEIDVFSGILLLFLMIQQKLAIWYLVPLPFLKPSWTSWSSWFTYCWSLDCSYHMILLLLLLLSLLSRVRLCVTPQTAAHRAPPSLGWSCYPTVSIHLEKTIIWKDTCIPVFIAELFTIARTWKQPQCPSIVELI